MAENKVIIRLANWDKDRDALSAIRTHVFIEEQHVPQDLEWDEFDSSATHFLAFEKDQAIACARLNSDGKISRMAVLADYRNKGTGKKLLQFIVHEAVSLKYQSAYLHAQVTAVAFYEKQGFVANSDIFYEANIAHREMSKKIG